MEFNFQQQHFDEADNSRYVHLSCTAISNTYKDVLKNEQLWSKASLGSEDVRWLATIVEGAKHGQN